MRIKELTVKNYQVVREAQLQNLGDFVVIAGPNGVGKTKIKDAIAYIFQNSGNPPPNCTVILEATNQSEETEWRSSSVSLPNQDFWAGISRSNKRIRTVGKFINIDSGRQIEQVKFQQPTMSGIGSPDEEDVGYDFSSKRIKDRFDEICNIIYRKKLKVITDLGQQAYEAKLAGVALAHSPLIDPTQPFEDIFGKLLYPKKMAPIRVGSPTIQYYDDEGEVRPFDQLSSGEKEALVLTFDILQQNPSDCVIVIDEPELHLHPELTFRLVKVLKSIGERNQFFLFTHSTDIISSSFDTGIHFLRPKSRVPTGNQILKVDSSNVGDLSLIPNLREAIGMLSLGKKLLFVEGVPTGIDRNVFATIAKSEMVDVAIISSEGSQNINNLGTIATTLSRGLFGLEFYMVRDRDSLTDQEVGIYAAKSNQKLMFLPYSEIENTFLEPTALAHISKKINPGNQKTASEISVKLADLARPQINSVAAKLVVNELRFKAGNFDATPDAAIDATADANQIAAVINAKKDIRLSEQAAEFSEQFIQDRVKYWKTALEQSLQSGWSEDSRKLFPGKSLLGNIQNFLFPGKATNIWQEIVNDEDPVCVAATQQLRDILSRLR